MTPHPLVFCLSMLLVTGCATRAPARTDTRPFAWKASLSLTIQAPRWDLAANVPATLLVRRPDVLFLQLRGPIGGPLAEACSDRAGVSVLLPAERRLLVDTDPQAAIGAATGGALALDGLAALLLGEAPGWDVGPDGSVALAEGRVAMLGRDAQGRLVSLVVRDASGTDLLQATWEGWIRREGAWRPGKLGLRVAPLDLDVEARFRSWEILGSVPVTCAHALPGGGPEGFAPERLGEHVTGPGTAPVEP
ncbi:MAG: hypothetical protein JXB39_02160 [Deltaproteobacteria bacterium]|nr:hypothetical protein [Deltaproteobacteria bacterium]